MARQLLDFDTYIELLRERNANVAARAARYVIAEGTITISAITVAEVVAGFRRSGSVRKLREFEAALPRLDVIPLTSGDAVVAGTIIAGLAAAGRPIRPLDPYVAAIAISHGLPPVTGNTAHFRQIQALGYPLALDNWREQ